MVNAIAAGWTIGLGPVHYKIEARRPIEDPNLRRVVQMEMNLDRLRGIIAKQTENFIKACCF
jgi:hypothetical protein